MNALKLSFAATLLAASSLTMAAGPIAGTDHDRKSMYAQAPAGTPATQAAEVQRTAQAADNRPKTRAEVREELARSKASGEYDRLTMDYVDPFPVRSR